VICLNEYAVVANLRRPGPFRSTRTSSVLVATNVRLGSS
jgi:hypothetical protein